MHAEAIQKLYERRQAEEPRRGYIGASMAGTECERAIWYYFRWATLTEFNGRMLRLFETGHREEERVIQNLKDIGLQVFDTDVTTGEQYRWYRFGGHFSGAPDGIMPGSLELPDVAHVLEVKTSSKKKFDELKKKGVKKTHPKHYSQMHFAMGMASEFFGEEFHHALYVAVHKDRDEMYFETIEYDEKHFNKEMAKVEQVINAKKPPTKINDDAAFFKCKMCDQREVCHLQQVAAANCRTCSHSTPNPISGDWECERHREVLTFERQQAGCEDHCYIPELIPYAEPIEFIKEHGVVKYRVRETGYEFINGDSTAFLPEVTQYLSSELEKIPRNLLGNEATEQVKSVLGGEVVEVRTET